MPERALFALAAGTLDLYLIWMLIRAPQLGVISTKWGKIFRDQAPGRFWTTWALQFVMAVIVFPLLIMRFYRAG